MITGNTITNNSDNGVYVWGSRTNALYDPHPIVTGNSLHSNTNYDYYTALFAPGTTATLDATGNWWGTTDPNQIAANIYDKVDGGNSLPSVDYGNYLDSEGGSPVGELLFGHISVDTTLPAGRVYHVTSNLTVDAGVTLPKGFRVSRLNTRNTRIPSYHFPTNPR